MNFILNLFCNRKHLKIFCAISGGMHMICRDMISIFLRKKISLLIAALIHYIHPFIDPFFINKIFLDIHIVILIYKLPFSFWTIIYIDQEVILFLFQSLHVKTLRICFGYVLDEILRSGLHPYQNLQTAASIHFHKILQTMWSYFTAVNHQFSQFWKLSSTYYFDTFIANFIYLEIQILNSYELVFE